MARLHDVLDAAYDAAAFEQLLDEGADTEAKNDAGETALHVAVRRYRQEAARLLLDHGADINARTAGGKSCFVHAARRGFDDLACWLAGRGADTSLNDADRLAILLTHGDTAAGARMLTDHPGLAKTGNPDEDRLLADLAGRRDDAPVRLLVEAGADLTARALDDGTALHQAAWFGQPQNAAILIEAGAPLDIFECVHNANPLGWAVHGSRYSGDAELRQPDYVAVTRLLLEAGSPAHYPNDPSAAFVRRMFDDATPGVRSVLEEFGLHV